METLLGCAVGGDFHTKVCAAALGMTFYRSLEFSRKEVVNNAVRTGELVLTPYADSTIDQIEIVNKIINFMVKDSTLNRMRRIVILHKEINLCKREKNESIPQYIKRLSGHVVSYPNTTNAYGNFSDSQNFAVVLLLNAQLTTQTF